MPKKAAVQQAHTKVNCAICLQEILTAEYADHIRQSHAAPATPAAPAAQPAPTSASPVYPPQPFAQQPVAANGNEPVTPPPPPAPRNPFVNAQVLYANGGKIAARIVAVHSAAGVVSKKRPDINNNRKGWLIDVQTDRPVNAATAGPNGQLVAVQTTVLCGRINEGDLRHQFLWGKFQASWVGQTITMRLPLPTENTKAGWLIE